MDRPERAARALRTRGLDTVHLPWQGWSLSLDDYLVSLMMEITVHSDDLAVSIDIETPELPRRFSIR